MSQQKTLCCIHRQFAPHLPPGSRFADEKYTLRRSNLGAFPRYEKIDGKRGEAFFMKSEVIDWAREKFARLFPERFLALCAALEVEPIAKRKKTAKVSP